MDYRTVRQAAEDEFTEKRSRFIGQIAPVTTEQQAQAFIADVKKRHWDARHNVWAYILRDGGLRRYSDDGEPQGTAGMPTLDVLQKAEVTDCVVVVTRYFGGILLGGGGLVRAYSHATSLAIAAGQPVRMELCDDWQLRCDYAQLGRVQPAVCEAGGTVDGIDYAEAVTLRFHAPCEAEQTLARAVTDVTAGTVICEKQGKAYRPV